MLDNKNLSFKPIHLTYFLFVEQRAMLATVHIGIGNYTLNNEV